MVSRGAAPGAAGLHLVDGLLDILDRVARLEPAEFHLKHASSLGLDLEHVTWEMNAANWAYTTHELAAIYRGNTIEGLAGLLH